MQRIENDPRTLIKIPVRVRDEIKGLAKRQRITMLQVVENAVHAYLREG